MATRTATPNPNATPVCPSARHTNADSECLNSVSFSTWDVNSRFKPLARMSEIYAAEERLGKTSIPLATLLRDHTAQKT